MYDFIKNIHTNVRLKTYEVNLMKPEEFKETTQNIISNLNDQGKVSDYLTQLTDVYETTHTTNTSLQDAQTEKDKEIQALKDTNMKLFLKIQDQKQETQQENKTNESPPKTYEDLVKDMEAGK